MGKLFSAPSIPSAPPPVVTAPDSTSAEESEAKSRLDNLRRRRLGRGGMVHTGYRGLLSEVNNLETPYSLTGSLSTGESR